MRRVVASTYGQTRRHHEDLRTYSYHALPFDRSSRTRVFTRTNNIPFFSSVHPQCVLRSTEEYRVTSLSHPRSLSSLRAERKDSQGVGTGTLALAMRRSLHKVRILIPIPLRTAFTACRPQEIESPSVSSFFCVFNLPFASCPASHFLPFVVCSVSMRTPGSQNRSVFSRLNMFVKQI